MVKSQYLEGHCAIVTGASGGIGFEFTRVLASMGCAVVLVDINERGIQDAVAALDAEYNAVAYGLITDLTAPDIVSVVDTYIDDLSLDPDILINNAGIFNFMPAVEMTDERVEMYCRLHVDAVTSLTLWFAKLRKPRHFGWILNMSSMSCWMPMPGIAMYSATKAYIRVFSRALHYELKDSGVSVTVACPGGISTDLFGLSPKLKNLAVRFGVLDTPSRFAKKAVKKMIMGKQQYINGPLNRLSIFLVGATPTWMRMLVKRKLLDSGLRR